MEFEGRVAVVTGGTGQLGGVIARHFVEHGARVAVTGRRPGASPAAKGVRVFTADLTSEGQVRRCVEQVTSELGPVDFLVHCAGGFAGGTLVEETPLDAWYAMLDANLTTAFLACRAVLPGMKQRRFGRIITIAALPAVHMASGRSAYAVAKRGVITLTEAIALETRGSGVTANAIAPGTILTEDNMRSMPGADTSRWVTPEDIAAMVGHLCSDAGRAASGNVITFFGGL